MRGRLLITKVDNESLEGFFQSPKRNEFVRRPRAMISMPIQPGMVLDVDYTWTSMSVIGVVDEKFHVVEMDVAVIARVKRPVLGESLEQSRENLLKSIEEQQNPSWVDQENFLRVEEYKSGDD